MSVWRTVIGLSAAVMTSACAQRADDLHVAMQRFPLSARYAAVTASAAAHCAETAEHRYAGAEAAPYREQVQIDCLGYSYRGAATKIELLVNEGALGFYWILLDEAALADVRGELEARWGAPTCTNGLYAIYAVRSVALRSEPEEILVGLPEDFRAITGGCG